MTASAALDRPASRLGTYASFVRFEHTLFSLPLILAGVFSAPGPAMAPGRWVLVAVAAVAARTAAMSINRLVDRRIDALNPRTQARELPAGRMTVREASLLLAISVLAYLAACAALGPWFLMVAPIPLVVFTGYPYLKRVTPLCHFGVGLALALAPLAGFAAAHPRFGNSGTALLLGGFALAWVSGFDIIYATLDEAFDKAHGVRSLVASLGRRRALAISAGLHLVAFALLALVARRLWHEPLPRPVWAVPLGALLLLLVATLFYLEVRWAADVNLAFFTVNVWVGFAVLAIVLVGRFAVRGPIIVMRMPWLAT
jgi:4-hydroxybenzoate polyprenyltransferase